MNNTNVTIEIISIANNKYNIVIVDCVDYPEVVGSDFERERGFFPDDKNPETGDRYVAFASYDPKRKVVQPLGTYGFDVDPAAISKPDEEPEDPYKKTPKTVASTDTFYIDPLHERILSVADKRAEEDGMAVIYVTGPSGYGKTSLGMEMATQTDRDMYILSTPTVRDTEEWFFIRHIENGETVQRLTDFTEYMLQGDCVIIIDEINRAEPWIANPLLQLLHFDRTVNVQNSEFTVGHNVVFYLTANVGIQYTGTNELDIALKNRADSRLHIDNIPEQIEIDLLCKRSGITKKESKRIVDFMIFMRGLNIENIDASPRMGLNIASNTRFGLPLADSIMSLVAADLGSEKERKEVIDYVNSKLS